MESQHTVRPDRSEPAGRPVTTRFAGSLTQVRTSSAVALAIWPPMRAIAMPVDGLFEVRTPSLIAWPARSDLLLGRRRTVSDVDEVVSVEEVVSLEEVGDAGVGTGDSPGVGAGDGSGVGVGVGVGAAGVTEADETDAGEVPAAFVAVTANVYGVPLVSPVTVHVVAGAVAVQVAPPAEAVAV